MNHLSFLADLGKCPNGWEERVGSNQCYLITNVHDMRTRDDASAQCKLQQGQLVKIDSIAERVIIFQRVSYSTWADPEGGGTGGPDPPGNKKNIGPFSNTGLDPLESHKVTKPALHES